MSSIKRFASLVPQLARGFRSTAATREAKKDMQGTSKFTHERIVYGDNHHGLRPGYTYDWEHGPHYVRPDLIPNFQRKWNIVVPSIFLVAILIPGFAVWWQQSKLKSS
uniref:Uncharacterized protein n=1 Tax=Chlamydomonas leiostraca TaxID=1034604 RepID=A0A7S0RD01_9CHLO|mmetsp:Transcript_19777/g.50198  ORF Transcript_19777/g.50198 Transcript_19777/m.50198 type:complete len:108 (+) Transcript_19777:300-623(+)|eukprot:CAMPEP_0202880088 /NCGR_PEP_ID=MMETSP1391-20130828/34573_1 /ASSEMBLY_ACC=CAM_ASM_000867 /TAXON_ID=1034604 /ORGANISM="Chlamydomonas leiostraca, Strain SAG 11-49" /LENGTH=107 /DNA_ID=CAMNT_0049562539 /DNA_START=215 /DNA_END=538 /DNA_ORIENTATION=-